MLKFHPSKYFLYNKIFPVRLLWSHYAVLAVLCIWMFIFQTFLLEIRVCAVWLCALSLLTSYLWILSNPLVSGSVVVVLLISIFILFTYSFYCLRDMSTSKKCQEVLCVRYSSFFNIGHFWWRSKARKFFLFLRAISGRSLYALTKLGIIKFLFIKK